MGYFVLIFFGIVILCGIFVKTPEQKRREQHEEYFKEKYGLSLQEAINKIRKSPHVDSVAKAIADYPYPDEIAVWHEVMHLDNTPVRFEALGFSEIPCHADLLSAFFGSLMEKLPPFYELDSLHDGLPIYIKKKRPTPVSESPLKDFL